MNSQPFVSRLVALNRIQGVLLTARLLQNPVYMNSQDTRRFLDAQHQELRAVLVEPGLAK